MTAGGDRPAAARTGDTSATSRTGSAQPGNGISAAQSGRASRARVLELFARVAYWSPVIAVLVLFAQVAFLGLRPAMAEARRLAEAEVMLMERHDRAVAENAVVAAHIAARQDPIFRERQRRSRLIPVTAQFPVTTQLQPGASQLQPGNSQATAEPDAGR